MLVKHWMTRNVIAIDSEETLGKAIDLMKDHRIRMLPVMHDSAIVGVLTDRDLKRASALESRDADNGRQQMKIDSIMTRNPICISFDTTIDETAELLLEKKISGAPVVDAGGNLIGVITQSNIYKALISLTGGHRSMNSVQFGVVVRDTKNCVKEIDQLLRNYGGRVISILTSDDNLPPGYRKVFLRMSDIDRVRLEAITEELKAKGELIYIIDHKDNIRMVYK